MKYEVTNPEGKRFEITAPEGATEAQILAYAKSQFTPTPQRASLGDVALGTPLGSLVLGVSDLITGPLQAGMNVGAFTAGATGSKATGADWINERMRALNEASERGRKESGREGYDWSRLAGSLGTSGIGQGVPLLLKAGRGLAGGARNLYDLMAKGGAERILTKYQKEIVGEENLPAVREALQQAKDIVPGSKTTAAQALAGKPAGSPLIEHQNITARSPGGPSALFGERAMKQQAARDIRGTARGEITKPMRERALALANQGGGVKVNTVIKDIANMETEPGWRTSDVVKKTLGDIRDKLASVKDKNWRVDARDLYTIRKEIGNTIQKYSTESASWDKALSAKLEGQIQKSIDDAIEAAGGVGWKQYLKTYSGFSKEMEADVERAKLALKPAQKTVLPGSRAISELETGHLPQMLSRPMMIANAIIKKLGKDVDPAIKAEAARRYLNPQVLADALKDVPPSQRKQLTDAITEYVMRGIQTGGPVAAGRELQ